VEKKIRALTAKTTQVTSLLP